jgi:transposase
LKSLKEGLATLGLGEVSTIEKIEETIKDLEKNAKELQKEMLSIKLSPEEQEKIDCLDSIVGITPVMARICYANFAHNDFDSKRAMLAYVGLDPKLKQS